MTLKQALDKISLAGISYGVPRHKQCVILLAGEHRVVYVPENDDWVGAGGQRGQGLDALIEGLAPHRLAA